MLEKACQERFETQRMTEVGLAVRAFLVVRAFLYGKGRLGKKIQQNEAEEKKNHLQKVAVIFMPRGKLSCLSIVAHFGFAKQRQQNGLADWIHALEYLEDYLVFNHCFIPVSRCVVDNYLLSCMCLT